MYRGRSNPSLIPREVWPLPSTGISDPLCIPEEPAPWCIQRGSNPRCIGREASPYVYRRNQHPSLYREKWSPPYTETTPEHLVKLDLQRSQQSDYNNNWPSCEIATQACRQSWVLVRAINTRCCTYWVMHYWWSSFEVWGPFLLRRKRPQWSPYGQHLTGHARQDQPYSPLINGG